MKLPKELTTVTRLSKVLAAILFVSLPFIGFFLGTRYQQILFARMEMAPVRELCDINQDGECDIADFDKFKEALGKKRGDLGYNPLADTNIDGVINGDDAVFPFPITLPADAYPTPTPTPIAVVTRTTQGKFCGGIAGVPCSEGYKCQLDGTYPDAGGKCVKL